MFILSLSFLSMCLKESLNYEDNVSLKLCSNIAFLFSLSSIFGLDIYKYYAIFKILLLITEEHSMKQINSVPFILISELIRSTPAVFSFLVVYQLFYSKEKLISFCSFFSTKLPDTFQNFGIHIPYGMKVSMCSALWQWLTSLHLFTLPVLFQRIQIMMSNLTHMLI